MKKCLSLLAILGLFLIVTSSFAKAPEFPEVPDVKLFLSEGLTPAFDLTAYNTGDPATSAVVSVNPLNLSAISTALAADSTIAVASVNYGPYATATSFAFAYALTNDGGTGTANNKVKYATYKINKLPSVGLRVGSYVDINVGNYVQGTPYPASFGNFDAAVVSDTTKVSATWQTNSTLRVQLNAAISAPVYVDVIAASVASQPYGMDLDKERITVYGNLLNVGDFAAASDTANFGYEFPNDAANNIQQPATRGWVASQADASGVTANGVATFTFTGANSGVKMTAGVSSWMSIDGDSWYIARMRCFAPATANTFQAQIFNYNGIIGTTPTVDISANILFGIPNNWTWVEAPLYAHFTSTSAAYPQVWFKGGVNGAVCYLDEVQYIKAVPTLVGAKRYDSYNHLARGLFNSYTELTAGWSTVEGFDTDNPVKATLTVTGGVLNVAFGAANQGIKLTAWNGPGSIYTPASIAGKEVGAKVDVAIASGTFVNNLSDIVLLGTYGVPSSGAAEFYNAGGQLLAAAQFGTIVEGTHYVAGLGNNGFHQLQLLTKAGHIGTLTFDNYDFLSDKDDPYYGDEVLFP